MVRAERLLNMRKLERFRIGQGKAGVGAADIGDHHELGSAALRVH